MSFRVTEMDQVTLLYFLCYNKQYVISGFVMEPKPRRYLPHSVFDNNRTFIELVNQIESSDK
jgi:hypothetical protein